MGGEEGLGCQRTLSRYMTMASVVVLGGGETLNIRTTKEV
jgi:hypothetical protein